MAKRFSAVLGTVLLIFGLFGSATGGHDHVFLGFGLNASHNMLHVLSGALALLAAAGGERRARMFCLAFGTLYGIVAVTGFFMVPAMVRALNLNLADDVLHLAVSVACLWVGGASRDA